MTRKHDPSTSLLWARFRFSVVGSLLVTMLSMSWGFRAVLLGAALLYVAAGLLLRAIPLERLEGAGAAGV